MRPAHMIAVLVLPLAVLGACGRDDSVPPEAGREDPSTGLGSESNRAQPVGAAPVVTLPYRARGNEPGWHLSIGTEALEFTGDYGEFRLAAPTPAAVAGVGIIQFGAQAEGRTLDIEISSGPCVDSMSGMPYPDAVTVRFDGAAWTGCGGEPAALLTGAEWVAEDLSGGLVAGSLVTIAFDRAGRASGYASCNRFTGGYTLTGESLTLGQMATTRMACEPQLMEQEQRFLEILGAVNAFAIAADGALILQTSDGRTIRLAPGS
jgi:heat shock protein HslJ